MEGPGLGAHLAAVAAAHPAREALVGDGRRVTFAELDDRTDRLAVALADLGVGAGSWVGLALPNRVELLEVAVAVWKLGGVTVPLNHRAPGRELAALVHLAGVALVVVDADLDVGPAAAVPLGALLAAAAEAERRPLPPVPTTPWKAVGSGGSTGRPKLIVAHDGGPVDGSAARYFGIRPGGRQLVAGPMYHNGPFNWAVVQLAAGGTAVVLPRFTPEAFLAAVAAERVDWVFVVPTMLRRLQALPADAWPPSATSSLRVLLHSAAPCPPALKRWAIGRFGATTVWEYYSSTELVASTMVRGDEWLARPGTVGRPPPEPRVVILDDDGRPLPPGEVGEIWAEHPAGPPFTYLGAEPRRLGDLYSVGDLGWLDDDGWLFLAERRADLIISGGVNVYPSEVEAVLLEHAGVVDAAVVGVRDDDWGQRVHAVVAVHPGGPTGADLLAHCRANLAPAKVPKAVDVVPSLPREPNGKLRRSLVRDWLESGQPAAASSAPWMARHSAEVGPPVTRMPE